jgi:hypothetical protein
MGVHTLTVTHTAPHGRRPSANPRRCRRRLDTCRYLCGRSPQTRAELAREWAEVDHGMQQIGFSDHERTDTQAVLATVLLLGQLQFDDSSSDEAFVVNTNVRCRRPPTRAACSPEDGGEAWRRGKGGSKRPLFAPLAARVRQRGRWKMEGGGRPRGRAP